MPDISDPHHKQRTKYIQALHSSPTQLIAALSGGGTLMLSDMLTEPGGSRTLIEAVVPYSPESLSDYIGRTPEQFCSASTARNLAMAAFYRAHKFLRSESLRKKGFVNPERVSPRTVDVSHDVEEATESVIIRSFKLIEPDEADGIGENNAVANVNDLQNVIGIGCTASLTTDREKKGEHRVHVAVQTLQRTIQFSLWFQKNTRSRWEEERLVADLILNAVETARQQEMESPPLPPAHVDSQVERASPVFVKSSSNGCALRGPIPLALKSGESIHGEQVVGSPLLVDLFFGNTGAVLWTREGIRHSITSKTADSSLTPYNLCAEFMQVIFPGSFSPIHKAHLEMIRIAEQRLQGKVALEISIQNVDKPPVDYIELAQRLEQIGVAGAGRAVWLTQTPLIIHKAELFRGATFIVGTDTLKRFADLRFYQDKVHNLHEILRTIALYDCRFLVFARQSKHGMESLETLSIPDMLRSLCDGVPPSVFTMDISSSDLRRQENS